MTQLNQAFRFRQSCLAAAVSLLLAPSVYALQDLPDEALSNTTGEGVALLPENFKFVFQGPNDVSGASSYGTLKDKVSLQSASKNDTGFIRIVPKGENYDNLYKKSYEKVVSSTYSSNYSKAQTDLYQPTFDSAYSAQYTKLKTENSNINSTAYKTEYAKVEAANKALYRQQEIESYYNSTTYKNYYSDRYDQYYKLLETLKDDGTTKYDESTWNADKSAESASKNTIEKIQLDKGAQIDKDVAAKIQTTTLQQIDQSAKVSATEYAKIQAVLAVQKAALNASNATANTTAKLSGKERTKADILIYGLALSKSNSDMNQRYSNEGVNWGSADNPWLFRAGTAKNIRQFNGANVGDIGYLALEAPLAKVGGNSSSDRLKLGFWTDIFSRALDSSDSINPVTGAPSSGLDKDYRLRAQVIANGLSIDGSQVRIFQTQSSSVAQQNETLGMASILRINTNDDPSALKFTDADLDAKGLRISTAAKTDADDGTLATPALEAGAKAPLFNDVEGLYLYSTNINLVLGNMYQPFILGSEGSNIILEVTRIPNIPDIYKKIYTYYADTDASNSNLTAAQKAEYLGSTCNVAQCGTAIQNASGQAIYQGNNATHSSISIGSVTRDSATNMLKANRDASATGVVFKSPGGNAVNLGSAVIDGVLIQHLKIKTTGL